MNKPKHPAPEVVRLEPRLDAAATQRLQARLRDLTDASTGLQLDLSEVRIVPSSVIGVFIEAHNRLAERGLSLELVEVRPELVRLFTIMGLDRHFSISEVGS